MSDPISPSAQSAWVRSTTITAAGEPLGVLLAITKAVGTYSYELRYRTLENITIGVALT